MWTLAVLCICYKYIITYFTAFCQYPFLFPGWVRHVWWTVWNFNPGKNRQKISIYQKCTKRPKILKSIFYHINIPSINKNQNMGRFCTIKCPCTIYFYTLPIYIKKPPGYIPGRRSLSPGYARMIDRTVCKASALSCSRAHIVRATGKK